MKRHTPIPAMAAALLALLLATGCRRGHMEQAMETARTDGGATTAIAVETATAAVPPQSRRTPDKRVRALKGSSLRIETGGMALVAHGGSVRHSGYYSVTSLSSGDLPSLPQGMENMTAAASGYRLLPSGEHFSPAAELRVAYDPARIPEGYTPDDIYTSYYDSAAMAWVRLERVAVDTARHEIVSLTTHFTDFINEILKAPEMPETQAFVPTMMSDLEAADPMSGETVMQPPAPNNDGTASLSYPLDIPAGRQGMQPSLALTYSSSGGCGWLGVGWDIPIPSITIDARWGVPRYDAARESEVYMYKGEQLVAIDQEGGYLAMPHRTSTWSDRLGDRTRFVPRVNEAFDSIVRRGARPDEYWWEVYDRAGVMHRYGRYETLDNDSNQSTLRDKSGNIARWCLTESEDAYGNIVRYLYDTVQDAGAEGGTVKGCQIYPAEIEYTLHRGVDGVMDDTGCHRVVFWREDNGQGRKHSHSFQYQDPNSLEHFYSRIPAVTDCRNGFKEVTASLLGFVRVTTRDTVNSAYYFGIRMDRSTNYKPVLANVSRFFSNIPDYFTTKGVIYRGYHGSFSFLDFSYEPLPASVFGEVTDIGNVWESAMGQGHPYSRDVDNIGFVSSATEILGRALTTTALSMSKGFNWNVGVGANVGLGTNVFWTELSGGGNLSHGRSMDRGVLTLADIDGDGLPDKLFKDITGSIWYRRHIRLGDGTFYFGAATRLDGVADFQKSTGSSDDMGLQLSLGVKASGSKTEGKTYVTTYLSDVNGDGVPDLVTDNGVYFNDPVGGAPSFNLAPRHTESGVADTVRTSTMPCGYIIYDGEVNDSIYCPEVRKCKEKQYRSIHDKDSGLVADFLDSGFTIMSMGETWVVGCRYERDCSAKMPRVGGGRGVVPDMEAVRVWVAPDSGVVTLRDTINMIPDRSGAVARSRYADGVRYRVQWNRGVTCASDTSLQCSSSQILASLSGTLAPTDTIPQTSSAEITVAAGDILFFRLQSGESNLGDRVDWRQCVTYRYKSTAADIHGRPGNRHHSAEDFVVCGTNHFQSPAAGKIHVDIHVETGDLHTDTTPSNITLSVRFHDGHLRTYTVAPNTTDTTIHVTRTDSSSTDIAVSQGDTLGISLSASPGATWGSVVCVPRVSFVPNTGSMVTDTMVFWPAPRLAAADRACSAVKSLFGPLYRGWGRFCYFSENTAAGDMIDPASLRCAMAASTNGMDTNTMKRGADYLNTSSPSMGNLSSTLNATGNYNPLSTARGRWRRMEPDCRHQAWLGYGNTAALTRVMASNTCPEEFFSEGEASEAYEMDCPAPAPTAEYPKVRTHARYTESLTENISFSVGDATTYSLSFSRGESTTFSDYMDMNGDRYPDLVSRGGIQYTMPYGGLGEKALYTPGLCPRSVTGSSGTGVATGNGKQDPGPMFGRTSSSKKMESVPVQPVEVDSPSPSYNAGLTDGKDTSGLAFVDMNGDGLPDKVHDDGTVELNIGYSFLRPDQTGCNGTHRGSYISGSGSASISYKLPFSKAMFSVGGGRAIGLSDNETKYQLMDVNGDGLPDMVEISPANDIYVHYNMGNGEWDKVLSDLPCISHGLSYNESVNLAATLGTTIGFAKVTGTVSGTPKGRSFSCERRQLTDIDGDGLPDYVESSGESAMTVRLNKTGRVNLLRSVSLHGNTLFNLDYAYSAPTYERPQGQWALSSCEVEGDAALGVPPMYTTYSYRNPRHDRFERVFLGFDTVISCQHDINTSGAYTPYRYVTEGYNNGSYQLRGKKKSLSVSDIDGHRWDETLFDITVVDMESGDTVGELGCPLVSYPLIEKTIVNHYEGHAAPLMTSATSLAYDSRRNVTSYINWGDTNRAGDEVRADMTYLGGKPRNMVSLRCSVEVRGGRQPSAPLMRRSLFLYDDAGGLASRTDLVSEGSPGVYAVTDYLRDAFGNVKSVTLPENATGQRLTYSYTYDPVLHRLPVRTTDSYGRVSSVSYSYILGKPLAVTDAAGNMARYAYDNRGRVVSVTAPNELAAGIPYTWRAEYFNSHCAKTFHYDTLHPSDPIETVTFCDRHGRITQVKRDIVENGTPKMQVSGRTVYDALGRTVGQCDPTSEPLGTDIVINTATTPLRSTTAYDILDREVCRAVVHNSAPVAQTTAYSYITAIGGGAQLLTTVTDPLGRVTKTVSDAYGRILAVTDAEGGSTEFVHDAMGQLLASSDPEGFTTTYSYDLLGRPLWRSHPDAGTTTTAYDPAGNVVSQTNNAGETVTFSYDYMRLVGRHYPRLTQNDVIYRYNTAGQVSEIQDGSGIQTFSYDAMGNVSENVRTFAIPYSTTTYTFTMNYEYDSWGRMLTMTYPDGEEVSYDYDLGGSLLAMSGSKGGVNYDYVTGVYYDLFGNRTSIWYDNHTRSEYVYDDLQRLENLRTYAMVGGAESAIQDIDYTFDNTGNITNVIQNASAAGSLGGIYSNSYSYDGIDRLTSAVQSYGAGNSLTAEYSPSGRLCSKRQSHTGHHSVYGYNKDDKPHAPRRIYDNEDGTLHDLRWDKSGNLAQVNRYEQCDILDGGRGLFWSEDSRLVNVADESFLSYYAYDHSGERVLKMTGRNSVVDVNADVFLTAANIERITLYTSPYLVAGNTGYTKHYYAGTERVCARVGNGGLDRLSDFIGSDQDLSAMAKGLFDQCLESMSYRYLAPNESNEITTPCSTVCDKLSTELPETPYSFNVTTDIKTGLFEEAMLIKASVGQDYEDIYFYHSDHLGSASWITDGLGTPVQHLQYLPFGESFVDQRAAGSTYNERFTFTGKERDEETGYGYFGARYMDHELMTMWLSVDPMADKYPNISPYAYCAWNPVKLVDPDGNFPATTHANIVWKASAGLGISIANRIKMCYGASFQSDIIHWKITSVHLDGYNQYGPNKPTDLQSAYNNAINDYSKFISIGDYANAGEALHTISDFYSHSNYIELYAEYAEANNLPSDIRDIPTFSEAQKDEKLMSFLNGKLKTGIFPDDKKNLENSHKGMTKDSKRKGNGGTQYMNTIHTMHDAAKETALKETHQVMEGEK